MGIGFTLSMHTRRHGLFFQIETVDTVRSSSPLAPVDVKRK